MFGFRSISSEDQAILAHAEKMLEGLLEIGGDLKQTARKLFDEAKAEAQVKFGDKIYTANFGELAVSNTAFMAPRLAAGLTEDDVRRYWNRPMLFGLLEMKVWEFTDFIVIDVARQQGLDMRAVAHDRRRKTPSFGNPEKWDAKAGADLGLTAADAELYPEFAARIDRWRELTPEQDQQARAAGYSTFNAMVRDLVSKGEL